MGDFKVFNLLNTATTGSSYSFRKSNEGIGVNSRAYVLGSQFFSSSKSASPFGDYALSQSDSFLSREVSDFINENKDLVYVLSQSSQAQELLKKTSIGDRDDLISVIAQTAHDLLDESAQKKISLTALENQSPLASMIVLNTAGVKDLFNQSDEMASLFSEDQPSFLQGTYNKLAQKAYDLLKEGNPLKDLDFLKKNKEVSLYLLGHKDLVQAFNLDPNGDDLAEEFKRSVKHEAYQDIFYSYASDLATQETESGAFNSTFFSNYRELSVLVGAGAFIDDVPPAAKLLRENPQMALNNESTRDFFNQELFLKALMTRQGDQRFPVSVTMDQDLIQSHSGFAALIEKNASFKKNLSQSEALRDLNVIFGVQKEPPLDQKTTQLLRDSFQSHYLSPASLSLVV